MRVRESADFKKLHARICTLPKECRTSVTPESIWELLLRSDAKSVCFSSVRLVSLLWGLSAIGDCGQKA